MKNKIATIFCGLIILFGFVSNIPGLYKEVSRVPYKKEENKGKEIYHNFKQYRDKTDDYFVNRISFKTNYIDINGLAIRLCGMRVMDDSQYRVVRLDDGHLSFVIPAENDLTYQIEQTKKLSDYLKKRKTPFLYVQAPYKVCKDDPQLPAGVEDYSNKMADTFLAEIRKAEINTLDLRDRIHKNKLDHHSLFYRTDHHWTPEAGIWATGEIASEMEKRYGFKKNNRSLDIGHYRCQIYKDHLLGSLGRRVGIGYAGTEDFKLFLPDFPAPMKYKICDRNLEFNVDFSQSPFVPAHLEKDYYNRSTYCVYTGGDFTHTELYNEKDTTGQKVLVIRESFATVVSPFLGLSCKQLDTLDLRYKGSEAKSFIDQINPDYVIVLYNPNTLTSNKAFDFIVNE